MSIQPESIDDDRSELTPVALRLVEFDATKITGSFYDAIPNVEAAEKLTTQSKETMLVTSQTSAVDVLLSFFDQIEFVPKYVDLDTISSKLRRHPAYSPFEAEANKNNRFRQLLQEHLLEGYAYYQAGAFPDERHQLDTDFLEILIGRSETQRQYAPMFDLFVIINEQHPHHQTLREAERVFRVLILNEIDELDVDNPRDFQ